MNNMVTTHDAQKILADFRDHLARHDKPLAFLFGAGTSCAVRVGTGDKTKALIPAVAGLTEHVKAEACTLGEKYAKAWATLEEDCRDNTQAPHIENILSRLRVMISAAGKADTLAGLSRVEILSLEEAVRRSIAKAVTPDLSLVSNFPHRKFTRWLAKTSRKNPVEIFTVNYDVLIEHALEIERVPAFDGFVGSYKPFFHPDSLRRLEAAPGSNWTRLWKMHGSVTWRRTEENGRSRVIRGAPDPNGEMIYPSFQKYDESRQQPYSAFTDRLSRFLEQDDAMLVVAGFSFGDEHINDLIFGALENRPRTHVYSLQFDELSPGSELMERVTQRQNMIVIGPKTGTIGGRQSLWAPAECPMFMYPVFELVEDVPAGEEAVKSGRMKIGDFACFCDFLESMTSG